MQEASRDCVDCVKELGGKDIIEEEPTGIIQTQGGRVTVLSSTVVMLR